MAHRNYIGPRAGKPVTSTTSDPIEVFRVPLPDRCSVTIHDLLITGQMRAGPEAFYQRRNTVSATRVKAKDGSIVVLRGDTPVEVDPLLLAPTLASAMDGDDLVITMATSGGTYDWQASAVMVQHTHSQIWIPSDNAKVKGWWDGELGVTDAGGALCSSWANQADTTWLAAVTAAGGARPGILATGFNGLPCLDFDGTDDAMSGTFSGALAQNFEIHCVLKSDNTAVSQVPMGGTTTDCFIELEAGGGNELLTIYAGVQLQSGDTAAWDTTALHFGALFKGATSKIWKNGSEEASGNANANGMVGLLVGDYRSGGFDFNGRLASMLITEELTGGERAQLDTFLLNRWGT